MKFKYSITSYSNQVKNIPYNLKAEAIAAQLLHNQEEHFKISAIFEGAFLRPFRKDIQDTSIEKDKNQLNFHLSRNGFYDSLPEGIFHSQQNPGNSPSTIKSITSTFKHQREEERNARNFFKPFEDFLFQLLVDLETEERSLLTNTKDQFNNFLLEFWDIPESISNKDKHFLINTLPYTNYIKGDLDEICCALSIYFNKEVSYKKEYKEYAVPNSQNKDFILGRNSIIGNNCEKLPVINFFYDDISDQEVYQFSKGGSSYHFTEVFLSYFLPIEFDYTINIQPNFTNEKTDFGVLGHSTQLNNN